MGWVHRWCQLTRLTFETKWGAKYPAIGDTWRRSWEHIVPLSQEAIDVLQRAAKFRVPTTDLVFPGQKLKKPLSDMALLKILRDMNLEVTVHGFRSAFRDWVAEQTSYPGEIAEAALAHAVSYKVEAAYR